MKNTIKVGDKIGYLRPHTGRYEWATVEGMEHGKMHMHSVIRQGRYTWDNRYTEETPNVIKFLKTPSEDWKDGRPLLKHKSVKN